MSCHTCLSCHTCPTYLIFLTYLICLTCLTCLTRLSCLTCLTSLNCITCLTCLTCHTCLFSEDLQQNKPDVTVTITSNHSSLQTTWQQSKLTYLKTIYLFDYGVFSGKGHVGYIRPGLLNSGFNPSVYAQITI
jgi:hypothetical protein